MASYIVYVLKSERDTRRYVGVTADLERRLREHAEGNVTSTRRRRPLSLIHTESFANKQEAWKRENFLKSGQGREWLRSKFGK